jgi:hypothetical protein
MIDNNCFFKHYSIPFSDKALATAFTTALAAAAT